MHRFFKDYKREFLHHYHNQSNIGLVFSMMKLKFGGCVRAKDSVARQNEVSCKAVCHNISVLIQEMVVLGVPIDFSEIVADEFMCKAEDIIK
jgi:hypothetical protein